MRLLPLLLTAALLFSAPAVAQSAAEVQKLPLLHDLHNPNAPQAKQNFTAAEKQIVARVAQAVNARSEFKAFLAKQSVGPAQAVPLNPSHVLLSFVAPYRSGMAERLTVFPVFIGDAAWLVFVFGEGQRLQAFVTSEHSSPLCVFSGMYTLRDINADGKREVAVVQSCGDGPGGGASLLVFGAGKSGFQFWGSTELTFQLGGDNQWSFRSSRLFVRKGKDYQIYAVRRLEEGFREGPSGAEKLNLTEEGVAVLRVNLLVSSRGSDVSLLRLF